MLESLKEARQWIILLIIIIVFSALGYYLFRSNQSETDQLQINLDQKDKIIRSLEEKLLEKPKVVIKYKDKIKYKDRVVYKSPPKEIIDLFNSYCAECNKLDIRPEIKIETEGIVCLANICNPADVSCKFKESVIDEVVVDIVNDLNKDNKILRVKLITGYEFVNSGLVAGISFLDYKGILLGTDIVANFNQLDSSGAGLFIGYQPKFKRWSVNLIFGVGVLTYFSNFNETGVQAFIAVPLLEKR